MPTGPRTRSSPGSSIRRTRSCRCSSRTHDDQHEWWNLRLYAGGGQKLQAGRELSGRAGERGRPRPRRRRLRRSGVVQPDGERVHRPLDQLFAGRQTAVVRHELRAPLLRRTSGPLRGGPGASAPATTSRSRPGWCPGRGRRSMCRRSRSAPPRRRSAAPSDRVPPVRDPARPPPRRAPPPEGLPAGRGRPGPARHSARGRLRGTRRADLIRGRAGNDRIYARAGADCVLGGRGADLLVGGPGRDMLDCGPGRRDRVVAGRSDRVRNCERRLTRRP